LLFYLTIYYKFLQILVDIFRGRFLCVDCLSRLSFLSDAFLVVFFRIGLAKGISEFFLKIYKEFFWKKFDSDWNAVGLLFRPAALALATQMEIRETPSLFLSMLRHDLNNPP